MRQLSLLLLVLALALPARAQTSFAPFQGVLLSAVTAAGDSGTIDLQSLFPFRHTVAYVVTGSPTTCTIELMGAITLSTPTASDWFSLSGSKLCTSNDMWHVPDRPVRWIYLDLTALSGGTNPTVTAIYAGTR